LGYRCNDDTCYICMIANTITFEVN